MNDDSDDLGLALWARKLANAPDVPEPAETEDDDDLITRVRWFQIPRQHRQRVIDALFAYLDRIVPDDQRTSVTADGPEITGFLRQASRALLN